MSKDEYLLTDTPLKALTVFAMPMILGSFFQQIYNMADSIIVGQFVGSSALAAVGACAALTNVFICVALGAGVGYACQVVGDERFYSVSAGAGECQYRAQEEVVEQLSFQLFRFPTGIKVVYVHHNQARRSGQAVAFTVGKNAAGSNVG